MFEAAELGHKVSKAHYARALPKLREQLLEAQFALAKDGTFPVIVLIAGVDGAGKGETVNALNEWMDPRHIQTVAFDQPTDEETQRPRLWRYVMALPPRGQLGILFGSWYTQPIADRVARRTSKAKLDAAIQEITRFEQMLADEGALILKFWFHLSKHAQKKRLQEIDRDEQRTWRVTKADWKQFERYDAYYAAAEHTLRLTSTGAAPWIVVEGEQARFRELTVGRTLLEALHGRLAENARARRRRKPRARVAPLARPIDRKNVLSQLEPGRHMSKKAYDDELERLQGKLNRLLRDQRFEDVGMTIAFEGMDAAGKGGAIRRVTGALDARQYHVIPIAAPTDEERAHSYLWRFYRHLPRRGRLTIYDRSWYGRVLVERVEGFCSEADFMRAYGEINDFEEQLVRSGTVLCKLWLQISKDEQLKRFREREQTRFKRFKITDEDWRNRRKWAQYQVAAADMIERTSTELAPWTLVPADDKRAARIAVLEAIVGSLRRALDARG
jgi:polyphosphate:AMP phosphotransferase